MENFCVVPEDRRYWVVRSEKGTFLQHFLTHRVAAIGHLDDLGFKSTNGKAFTANWATITERLIDRFERLEESRRSGFSIASQAKTFVEEIQVGDWVIAPSGDIVAIGRVESHAYLDTNPLYAKNSNGFDVEMPFGLRRNVAWGARIVRGELSSPLRRSMAANQTVFNVDEHWESIYHALFGSFLRGDTLYFTARLKSDSAINNIDVTSFLSVLTDIEVMARGFDAGLEVETFESFLKQYRESGSLSLTTKAEFYSPGDIWVQLVGSGLIAAKSYGWVPIAVLAYNMLFGNKKKGMDGVLDLKTRQRLWGLVIDRMEKRGTNAAIENMQISQPAKGGELLSEPDKKQ